MSNPAVCFAPGDYIQEELKARGWCNLHLADLLRVSDREIDELLLGEMEITPDLAQRLSAAFGTSAQLWLNLQASYSSWIEAVGEELERQSGGEG